MSICVKLFSASLSAFRVRKNSLWEYFLLFFCYYIFFFDLDEPDDFFEDVFFFDLDEPDDFFEDVFSLDLDFFGPDDLYDFDSEFDDDTLCSFRIILVWW